MRESGRNQVFGCVWAFRKVLVISDVSFAEGENPIEMAACVAIRKRLFGLILNCYPHRLPP
jgi:hypothetical protein